jgi:RNA polymerase sigma-70 factor (ECF subfamily)
LEVSDTKSDSAWEDQQLVQKAQEGDQDAFSELMSKYRDSIFYMVLKMVNSRNDAEDLTMESFAKAFNNLKRYDFKYAFSTWLFKIATNNSIDFIRKKKLDTHSIDEPIKTDKGEIHSVNIKTEHPDPEQKVERGERIVSVRSAVKKLKDKYRTLIELRYYEELSYDEIAEQLDLPLGTVKAQLYRAKELLSNIMEGKGEDI